MARFRPLMIFLVCIVALSPARAAMGWIDYSPERFADAQAAGKTILVDVTADWCPTCKAQQPILDELSTDERLQEVLFIRLDFDVHKDFLQEHRIPRQSTIVIFEGGTEVDRSIAETNRERLSSFVFTAVQP